MLRVEDFIATVRRARAAFDEAVGGVPEARWLEPGVTGTWSVKDVIAHVNWFEQQMVVLIRAHALVGSDHWQLPAHERNDVIFRESRNRSLEDVRAGSTRTFAELLSALATLVDEDLANPARFPGMPPDWKPADILAQNTCEHYDAHLEGLRVWLAGPASPAPEDPGC